MGNERSRLQKRSAEDEGSSLLAGCIPKVHILDRLQIGPFLCDVPLFLSKKKHLAKLRSSRISPFRRKKLISESDTSSSSSSVILLKATPVTEDIFRDVGSIASDDVSKKEDVGDYYGSSTSSASACSSGTSMASFKRSARGRSCSRWYDATSRSDVIEDRSDEYSSASGSLKTPWPVTVKVSLFYPQFPSKRQEPAVEEWLSRGHFSSVFKVAFMGNDKSYALKRISKSFLMHNAGLVQQVKEEAQIQKECCYHPFLLCAVDSWQTRTHVCILTPFMEGGDLDELAHRYVVFPEQVVKIWAAEIGIAVGHLHQCGVLHRDLKLANILVDTDGHLKLTDFGLAKFVSHDRRTRTICGTLEYMSPEVMTGSEYSTAADWWSYGILLYRLLIGRYPLSAEQDHLLMREKVAEHCYIGWREFEDLQGSPTAICLLVQLLTKDPDRRLQSFDVIMKERFFKDLDFTVVSQKKISPLSLL